MSLWVVWINDTPSRHMIGVSFAILVAMILLQNLYTINKHLISLLDKYKTTYKEDITLINRKTLDSFSNKYNAMVVIANEKKIIQHYIEGIFKLLEYIDLEPAQRILDEAYLIDYFNLRK